MDKAAAHQLREFCSDLHGVLIALSAPIRLEILVHIMGKPSAVTMLSEELELSVTLVSKHLCSFRESSLARGARPLDQACSGHLRSASGESRSVAISASRIP